MQCYYNAAHIHFYYFYLLAILKIVCAIKGTLYTSCAMMAMAFAALVCKLEQCDMVVCELIVAVHYACA